MLGVQFSAIEVSSSGVYIKDIQGDFEEEDELQFAYTDEGGLIQFNIYTYFTADGGMVDEDGWYNGDFEAVGDELLPIGGAMWFFTSSGDAKAATMSGQITKDPIVRTFSEANNMICGSFPVAFNPNGKNVSWSGLSEEDEIQVAYTDSDGLIQFTVYTYFTADGGMVDEDGWYDGDFSKVESAIVEVGQGFWLFPQSTVTLTETSPLK